MRKKIGGYLRLARPANLPTAAADILAGVCVAGVLVFSNDVQGNESILLYNVFYLILSSVLLYAGGVVLNDVFDHKVDKIERPERPIPSGLISLPAASFFGGLLLVLGVASSYWVGDLSVLVALLLAMSILLYDAIAKKHEFFGPLVMGFCRALNLILGISILGELSLAWLAIVPMIYIYAITLISRGEVHGNNKNHIIWAGVLYSIVIFTVIGVLVIKTDNIIQTIPFILLFGFLVFKPLVLAYKSNSPRNIKKAVIAGVLSLIVLDAALGTGFSDWMHGLMILALLPISMFLSKLTAVT